MSRHKGKTGRLDELDLNILKILQRNSRESFSEISKKLGVPEATVRYRVKKLVNSGVIKGFYALIDPRKVGLPFSMIILIDTDPGHLDEIFEKLKSMPETSHAFRLTGKYNVVAIFHARDMEHVNMINERVRSFKGIRSVETLLVTGLVYINPELPL